MGHILGGGSFGKGDSLCPQAWEQEKERAGRSG